VRSNLHMDPRERFTETVTDYRRYRPSYPEAIIDWIVADAGLKPGDTVVDVGCGTGISSRLFAARDLAVVGVDPNPSMLEAAKAEGSDGIRWVLGDGESLPIDDVIAGPVRAIVGGQSFHWLDVPKAFARFREVLADDGRVVPFWNLRDASKPLMARYEMLLRRHCPEYVGVGAEPRAEALIASPEFADRRLHNETHQQTLARDAFIGRVWSSSYVKHGVSDRETFDAALHELFDSHQVDGFVTFDYVAVALSLRP
jgi:ubiquinone/menaquinone biosynthesis C-methylase UbiE